MVNTVDAFLEGAAESSFAAVAGSFGSILMVASTLLIVLVFINLALQMRPMDGSTAVGLVVRLLLISAEVIRLSMMAEATALNCVQLRAKALMSRRRTTSPTAVLPSMGRI